MQPSSLVTGVGRGACLLFFVIVGGCGYTSGSHMGQGTDYAREVFSLYDEPQRAAGGATRSATLEFPLNVAVAEVNELAPPPRLVAQLRERGQLFRRVEGIPGIADGDVRTEASDACCGGAANPDGRAQQQSQARAAMQRTLRFTRDLGTDYVLLVGATVDSESHETGMSLLDLTIVGAYLVPSRHITGRARASAVLVDARSGRAVLSAVAQADDARFASAVGDEGGHEHLIKNLRDAAFADLARQIIETCAARAGAEGGAAPAAAAALGKAPDADPFAASVEAPATHLSANSNPSTFTPLPPDPVRPRKP